MLFKLFKTDQLAKMQKLRDQAERVGLMFLEEHAIKGTITRRMVMLVGESLNINIAELLDMIPDRRRVGRFEAAMAGLRKAELIRSRETFDSDHHHQ
jgi:hypothetical protein